MRSGLVSMLLSVVAFAAGGAEVTRVGRWELHSSFWMNLHQTLMHDASARTPRDFSMLSDEERLVWTDTVARYREAAGSGSITFAGPMMELQNELTQIADDAVDPPLRHPLGDTIRRAAPVYRSHWWSGDDAANRFFIAYTSAMLDEAGEEIVREHERVYGEQLPSTIRVDAAAYAGTFGAYTHPLEYGLVITIASRDMGNHGLAALELVIHESSHGIVFPRYGRVARAIAAAAGRHGIDPPRDLWHALLFSTSSELTVRALERRGVSAYVPMSNDLFTRVWPQYRDAIESFWHPYLHGDGTLEEAVEKIVADVAAGSDRTTEG